MGRLIEDPNVVSWLKGDLSFLREPDDSFRNKTAEKKELYSRENEWAWNLFNENLDHRYNRGDKWSGKFGQLIFEEMSPTGWKPERRGGFLPDWEDPYFVYELKTQFHLSGGTAQEKIPAVPIKYMDIPELYGKPLRVICFAGAEVYAKKFFKDSQKTRQQLALWKSWKIEYVWGSNLAF